LYIVDDQGNDSGTISGGWSLILTQLVLFGSGAITINDAAPATPYPSTISVSGMPHKVQDVKVVIGGFTHTCPGDVDMLLVAPGGQRFVPFSDAAACNPGVTSVNFILADQSIQSLPDLNGAVVPGQYLPTNNGSADAFAAPAPVGPYPAAQPAGSDSFHSAFAGIDPNGTWSLYVVDDLVGDAGSMAGWTLAITTQAEFSNFNAVTISDVSPATPYPVTINVGDIPGTLVGAYLRVNGLTHSFPLDIDLMLADPSGRGFIAQSDAGSGADVNLITYTLDDAGATPLPEATNLADGAVYTPGNYALTTDVFPLPAPQAGVASPQTFGGATFGSVYLGGDPNGAWHIYIVDDSGGDSGTIVNGLTLGVVTIFDDVFVDGFDD
jgi:subtilisin-like proprotein convertase family protein